jgi:hypothetical protein
MDPVPSSLDAPGLGRLTSLPDSPPGEQFWEGVFHYQEGGRKDTSRFYFCVTDGVTPSAAQLATAQQILADIDRHIEGARALLKAKLEQEPEFFGIDATEAAAYLAKGDALLPFGMPEPTFYQPPEWQLRFAESVLPACAQLGVTVAFEGELPGDVIDLSDSEELG